MVTKTGTANKDLLEGTALDDILYGLGDNDTLIGGGGGDLLDGGLGADLMYGGNGNDQYWVDTAGDTVTELAGEGRDQVNSSISYTLGANVEDLRLMKDAGAINGIGNELDNFIWGNKSDNVLKGGGGDDVLNGYGGADKMYGGTGNDYFIVNSSDDVVVEFFDQGFDDIIYTSVSYTMPDNVERMIMSSEVGAINGYGSAGNDVIFGNDSDNILSGNDGNDSLWGGGGNDLLAGGKGGDVLDGGSGINTLAYLTSSAGVLVNLGNGMTSGGDAQGDVISKIQNVVGSAKADSLFGDGLANVLNGAGGNDFLFGGVNSDTFQFTGNFGKDTVLDFHAAASVGADSIEHDIIALDQGMFANFAAIQAAMQQVGMDTVITFNAGNTITLQNVVASTLQASDFHLV
jgi:serralysin